MVLLVLQEKLTDSFFCVHALVAIAKIMTWCMSWLSYSHVKPTSAKWLKCEHATNVRTQDSNSQALVCWNYDWQSFRIYSDKNTMRTNNGSELYSILWGAIEISRCRWMNEWKWMDGKELFGLFFCVRKDPDARGQKMHRAINRTQSIQRFMFLDGVALSFFVITATTDRLPEYVLLSLTILLSMGVIRGLNLR